MKYPVLLPNIFDHPFTYLSNIKLKPGDYVKVPFGKKNIIGVIWDIFEEKNKKEFKLKSITEKIEIARKDIGIFKHLSSYLPLRTPDQIFKIHVRPHLDYCDVIYHIPVKTREMSNFDCSQTLQYLMKLLESTQYQAALAVSGVWKGTSREIFRRN